jgi:dTDP-4-amino-4,6-dideoxygalactose transaminase
MFSIGWQFFELRRRIRKAGAVAGMALRDKTSQYPKTVQKFEAEFAKFVGVKHAATFANGTTAIEAAIFALNLPPGAEVIAPSYTIHSTFSAALVLGHPVVFCDIDAETLNIDPQKLETLITPNTGAIIVVHIWGNPVDMDAVMEIARKHRVRVIEDCSHSHGAKWNGQLVGSIGDIGVFSLQGAKAIAAGEGGVVTTSDDALLDRMLAYGHQGRRVSGTQKTARESDLLPVTGLGRKSRAHPLGIAMARVDLSTIGEQNRKCSSARKFVVRTLTDSRCLATQMPPSKAEMGGFYMGAAIRVLDETLDVADVMVRLRAARIKVARRNHAPYHKMPHLYDMRYRERHIRGERANPKPASDLPITEAALERTLLLPLAQFSSRRVRHAWQRFVADIEGGRSGRQNRTGVE